MNNKMLYIEDNYNNARLFKKLMRKYPHDILIAETATQGLDLLEQHAFDMLFIDINLPDIDGITLVQQLKADRRYAHIPMMAVTANAMSGDREICLDAGFDAYVAKPLMRVELYYLIDYCLSAQFASNRAY